MKKRWLLVLALPIAFPTAMVQAVTPQNDAFLEYIQFRPELPPNDLPASSGLTFTIGDTVCFGGHDGNGYAVEGETWDFDDGTLQGWYGIEAMEQPENINWGRMAPGDFECPESAPDGHSYHFLTDEFDDGTGGCVPSYDGIVGAASSEISAALDWIFSGAVPSTCSEYDCGLGDSPDAVGTEMRVNRLYQNQPNPFNPRTVLRFSVASGSDVELAIYDVSGRLVKMLVEKPVDAGLHQVIWDGRDGNGNPLASGIYWSQLRAGDYVSSKKMILLK